MAPMIGADVDALRMLARRFEESAAQLTLLSITLDNSLGSTLQWRGPDAARARSAWSSTHRRAIDDVAHALRTAAETIVRNAEEQREASAGKGGAMSAGTADTLRDMRVAMAGDIAGDIALTTVNAYIEGEVEFATFKTEGKMEAGLSVYGDGHVSMNLRLEGGLGRKISVGGQGVDASAGATTELVLEFGSLKEAKKFLAGLDNAAFDLDWRDASHAPAAVAQNVADYIEKKSDITSFKVGAYGKVHGEFGAGLATGEAEARVDASYDMVRKEYELKMSASIEGSLSLDGESHSVSASAELSGSLTLDKHQDFKSLALSGRMSAALAAEKLGFHLPQGELEHGVDVELKVSKGDPGYEQIKAAVLGGDMGRATDLAMAQGQVVVRQTSTASIAHDEIEVEKLGQGVRVEYGATVKHVNHVWIRQAGGGSFQDMG